jgi:CBS domain-containing protein
MSDPVYAQLLALIGTADDVKTLRGLRDQIHEQMEAMLSEQPVEQFYIDLNEAHDALIRRTIALSEAQMARMGNGSPPVPYAYLLFGSGGREEQTLSSDQDSGIVYGAPEEESDRETVSLYFRTFAGTVVEMLQQLGYPPCDGNVISSNPEWCLSITEWKTKLNLWFEEPDWERVRYLLIVADCRLIYGDSTLLKELKDHYYTDTLENPVIVRHMLNNTMRHKVLIGVFGQLLKEQYGQDAGSLDVKYGAYIPMVNSIRLMSIQAGLRETSTLSRIRGLLLKGKLTAHDAASYAGAFRLFLRLRLMTTERNDDGLYANNGKLAGSKLTRELIEELKNGLRLGKRLQRRVNKETMGRL